MKKTPHRQSHVPQGDLQGRDAVLSVNARAVLARRYLLKDTGRVVVETPVQLFRRVARAVAAAEDNFPGGAWRREAEGVFFGMMQRLEFLPNSPTLMNAGTPLGQLSACFVLPVDDSIKSIFAALSDMACIHQSGGGTGFDFSRLRPHGDMVYATRGEASGPVSFMRIFDAATGVIVQGGRRRGANMGILRVDHPDIGDFIDAKLDGKSFSNFNLSIAVTDSFMRAAARDRRYSLVSPRTQRTTAQYKARDIFNRIARAAWRTGDPGVIFIDEVNRRNPTPAQGPIAATNPCGEQPLLSFESCTLGSLNLAQFVTAGGLIDWERLSEGVYWGVRFLDDVIEVNKYPLAQIRAVTLGNRKIGLGVMGFADMLIKLGIPYDSDTAVGTAHALMRFIRAESVKASMKLAARRGVFPHYRGSLYARKNMRMRNATVNTIAPTGTISIIAGCSSGIEPLFALSFTRRVFSGTRLSETNPLFELRARERGFYSGQLLSRVAQAGSIRGIAGVPRDIKRLFVTAFDVTPEAHLRIQAAFQRYTDNAVSKTINLDAGATVEQVRHIYRRAHHLKCKGITVYRYGTKENQALSFRCEGEVCEQ